jgi:hypothetical protein
VVKQNDNIFLKASEVLGYLLPFEYELFNVGIGTYKHISNFDRWTVKFPFAA